MSTETAFLDYDELIHETDAAWLILFEPGVQKWMPKSIGIMHSDGTIEVDEWWVEKNETEDYIV